MKIGVIGLGRMGRGIAGRVLGAGHDLAVYNRTPGKDADLVAAGARSAATIALACEERDVVVSMLAAPSMVGLPVRARSLGSCPQLKGAD